MKTNLKAIAVFIPLLMAVFVVQAQTTQIADSTQIIIEEKKNDVTALDILDPVLLPVCGCESVGNPNATPQQFHQDGSVIRGIINPQDIGMCQINEHYWLEESLALGYDIYTAEGNARMANHILETQGIEAWRWSNGCHHALDGA